MTREKAFQVIVESLRAFVGDDDVSITARTRPIGDLGLDSEDAIAWVCDVDEIGFVVPDGVVPFVDEKRHRARTVDQIVDLLLQYAK